MQTTLCMIWRLTLQVFDCHAKRQNVKIARKKEVAFAPLRTWCHRAQDIVVLFKCSMLYYGLMIVNSLFVYTQPLIDSATSQTSIVSYIPTVLY